jgi:probable addiction module antidote protein
MGKTETTPWDSAEYLTTPTKRALYLEAMMEESNNDPAAILFALNTIARSEGMTNVARTSGLSRENLYRSLSGNKKPEFGTILKVMSALGLQFHVVAKAAKAEKAVKGGKKTKVILPANGTVGGGAKKTPKSRSTVPSGRSPRPATPRPKARIKQAA